MRKDFTIKDSGQRQSFEGGMQRDVTEGKTKYHLVFDGPMLKRWAEHLTKGAKKYDERNWMKASGLEEYKRFIESATRHFFQWLMGEEDEDHAAAVLFNINGAEYVKDKMDNADLGPTTVELQLDAAFRKWEAEERRLMPLGVTMCNRCGLVYLIGRDGYCHQCLEEMERGEPADDGKAPPECCPGGCSGQCGGCTPSNR